MLAGSGERSYFILRLALLHGKVSKRQIDPIGRLAYPEEIIDPDVRLALW